MFSWLRSTKLSGRRSGLYSSPSLASLGLYIRLQYAVNSVKQKESSILYFPSQNETDGLAR